MISKIHEFLVKVVHKGYWAFFAAACVTLALFCFYRLDVKYVDSWDEARHGVNAYEMIQNDNYIQHTYNYEVDDWNLKPSLSYWGILVGFGIFGYSVLGLRFYSALCYLVTGVVTSLFVRKRSRVGSILVLGFFCANTLPLYAHLARAGDADSLYLMLFTFAMLAMMEIPKNRRCLHVCGLCFSMAFLTKSWHAGMIAAIGGLYLLLTGELRRIRLKEWLLFLGSVLIPLVLWFGWRYQADGFTFLRQMVEVDLLARTGTDNFEGHSFPFSFYWEMVFGNKAYIYPWVVGVCGAGVLAGVGGWLFRVRKSCMHQNCEESHTAKADSPSMLRSWKNVWKKDGKIKDNASLAIGLFLWFAVTFLGFSAMKTKLIWYCYPAIVPLYTAAAVMLGRLLEGQLLEGRCAVCSKADTEEKEADGSVSGEMKKHRMRQVLAAGQIMLAAGCILLTAHFMKVTYDTAIGSVHGDHFQDFLRISAQQDSAYAGADAYIQVVGEKPEQLGDWDQNRLFLAEISGNFHCLDGGVEGFLQGAPDSVLYIDQANYVQYQEQLAGCKTLFLDMNYPYVLICK